MAFKNMDINTILQQLGLSPGPQPFGSVPEAPQQMTSPAAMPAPPQLSLSQPQPQAAPVQQPSVDIQALLDGIERQRQAGILKARGSENLFQHPVATVVDTIGSALNHFAELARGFPIGRLAQQRYLEHPDYPIGRALGEMNLKTEGMKLDQMPLLNELNKQKLVADIAQSGSAISHNRAMESYYNNRPGYDAAEEDRKNREFKLNVQKFYDERRLGKGRLKVSQQNANTLQASREGAPNNAREASRRSLLSALVNSMQIDMSDAAGIARAQKIVDTLMPPAAAGTLATTPSPVDNDPFGVRK